MTVRTWVLIVIAFAFGLARLLVPGSGSLHREDVFKDFSHLYVGGLFGAWLATGDKGYRAMAAALTVLETVAFFAKH